MNPLGLATAHDLTSTEQDHGTTGRVSPVTLILAALTPTFIILVSDRQLTYRHSGKPADDAAMKAVFVNGHYAFAYTGPAEVQRSSDGVREAQSVPTYRWIAEVAADHTGFPDPVLGALAEGADDVVPSFDKGLIVIGVGWAQDISTNPDGVYRPILALVHRGKDGAFMSWWDGLKPPVPRAMYNSRPDHKDKLSPYLDAVDPDSMEASAMSLVAGLRAVASSDSTVSEDALLLCIPLSVVQATDQGTDYNIRCDGPLSAEEITYQHYKIGGVEPMEKGPALVIGSNILIDPYVNPGGFIQVSQTHP